MKLDSAAMHLRSSLDPAGHPTRDDQVQAWLLLGVISFYKGDDSGTSADFRHALALDPLLKADGLARYDSALVVLFNAQRKNVVADPGPPAEGANTLVDCTKTCPSDVVLPRLDDVSLFGIRPDGFEAEHDRWGLIRMQFIVDTAGYVAPGSLRLIESALQMRMFERALLDGLQRARFIPGRLKGQRIPVLVEGKLVFHSGYLNGDSGLTETAGVLIAAATIRA
ncbi:MAG TPA: hypothetical protein VGV12_00795 [Gemmatimonadales bacterium]|nr:hypothetical protein [Gemmatimonadales bacterium]